MKLLWSLYGVMEVITKGADGSRSGVFMVPVKMLSALAGWQSGTIQTSGLEALVYLDNEIITKRGEQSGTSTRWLFRNPSTAQVESEEMQD